MGSSFPSFFTVFLFFFFGVRLFFAVHTKFEFSLQDVLRLNGAETLLTVD